MNANTTRTLPDDFRTLLALAQLLERLERTPVERSPDQYRALVQRLSGELANVEPGPDLHALLDACPATAELYENLHYVHAGLCRSPLDESLNAEKRARQLISAAAGR